MLCTKLPDGSILISDIINQQYVKKTYQGYSKTMAIKLFRAYKKQIQQNWLEYLAK
jgi:hypothetical protein